MLSKLSAIAAVAVIVVISGCSTYATPRYSMSVDNDQILKKLHSEHPDTRLAVAQFTSDTGERTEITCRAVGPIVTPDGETFSAFISKALVDEMKFSGIYSKDAVKSISGHITKLNFSSTSGHWAISANVSVADEPPFTVTEVYDYDTSFFGETACNQTAQAFGPAVQDFVKKVVSHPAFQQAFMIHSASTAVTGQH